MEDVDGVSSPITESDTRAFETAREEADPAARLRALAATTNRLTNERIAAEERVDVVGELDAESAAIARTGEFERRNASIRAEMSRLVDEDEAEFNRTVFEAPRFELTEADVALNERMRPILSPDEEVER